MFPRNLDSVGFYSESTHLNHQQFLSLIWICFSVIVEIFIKKMTAKIIAYLIIDEQAEKKYKEKKYIKIAA